MVAQGTEKCGLLTQVNYRESMLLRVEKGSLSTQYSGLNEQVQL